jgi:predicted O-methyltransferase YrrM
MGDFSSQSTRLYRALGAYNLESMLGTGASSWFRVAGNRDPAIAFMLDDGEIQVLADWHADIVKQGLNVDIGFPVISFVGTLIYAHQMRNVVQLGHYVGFSSLIIGMILRKISPEARLISFDIDQRVTDCCNEWIDRAGLAHIVCNVCADSTDPITAEFAGAHLTGQPELAFIDASKQYQNTITEIRLWSKYINGFIISHDVSALAKGDQANGPKGVADGLVDSAQFAANELLIIDPHAERGGGFPYIDPCGLGIGLVRGRERLPSNASIAELMARRQILEPSKLNDAENWFLTPGFKFAPGALTKTKGAEAWATCFAPIQSGQRLSVELGLSRSNDETCFVTAGGPPGTMWVPSGSGRHTGVIEAGAENSRIGIYGAPDSEFTINYIRVWA